WITRLTRGCIRSITMRIAGTVHRGEDASGSGRAPAPRGASYGHARGSSSPREPQGDRIVMACHRSIPGGPTVKIRAFLMAIALVAFALPATAASPGDKVTGNGIV